ncbi:universal stress protein [Streptomyces harbinensis]|uniref:universal stress protein n=1 Tax=Streptomyces harbinensis TaxID=1176198 RepID=UPI00371000D8
MTLIVWITEAHWTACVDAARARRAAREPVTLLHVTDEEVTAAAHGAFAGLLGRGHGPGEDPARRLEREAAGAAAALLERAAQRLGGPVRRLARTGRTEDEVLAALSGPGSDDVLVCARDGDRSRPGPHTLAPPTRFVVDHAPCPVLLVW